MRVQDGSERVFLSLLNYPQHIREKPPVGSLPLLRIASPVVIIIVHTASGIEILCEWRLEPFKPARRAAASVTHPLQEV